MDLEHPLAWWLANDIVLDFGQRGIINDLGWYKVGDGNNPFSGLDLLGIDGINVWFSYCTPSINKGAALTTLFHATLIGGTLVEQNGWVEFNFTVKQSSNLNPKKAIVKFANQIIISVDLPAASVVPTIISGKIKVSDYSGEKAIYSALSCSSFYVTATDGELDSINWAQNNVLLFQVQGVDNGDICSSGGDGKICIVSRF